MGYDTILGNLSVTPATYQSTLHLMLEGMNSF